MYSLVLLFCIFELGSLEAITYMIRWTSQRWAGKIMCSPSVEILNLTSVELAGFRVPIRSLCFFLSTNCLGIFFYWISRVKADLGSYTYSCILKRLDSKIPWKTGFMFLGKPTDLGVSYFCESSTHSPWNDKLIDFRAWWFGFRLDPLLKGIGILWGAHSFVPNPPGPKPTMYH